jgi:phage shock protein A
MSSELLQRINDLEDELATMLAVIGDLARDNSELSVRVEELKQQVADLTVKNLPDGI